MILDDLANAARYESLHGRFAAAFAWLRDADTSALEPGRHDVDGEKLYVNLDVKEGRTRDGARLETHRRFIDIQYTFDGSDDIGWLPAAECREVAAEYDEAKDIARFADTPASWVTVRAGTLAIFFPEDGHAPLGGTGTIRKLIAKVAVD
jgi:biofilm protein TabA